MDLDLYLIDPKKLNQLWNSSAKSRRKRAWFADSVGTRMGNLFFLTSQSTIYKYTTEVRIYFTWVTWSSTHIYIMTRVHTIDMPGPSHKARRLAWKYSKGVSCLHMDAMQNLVAYIVAWLDSPGFLFDLCASIVHLVGIDYWSAWSWLKKQNFFIDPDTCFLRCISWLYNTNEI